jgi:hypothetical protein
MLGIVVASGMGALEGLRQCRAAGASAQFGDHARFFDGSVPLAWLVIAAKLPARSLHVGMVVWYAAGVSGSASVHLSNTLCLRFGLDRNAKYRGLRSLELAGLVAVKRRRGRSPLVTILVSSDAR